MSSFGSSSAMFGLVPRVQVWEDAKGSNQDMRPAQLPEGHVDYQHKDRASMRDRSDENPSAVQLGEISKNLQLHAGSASFLSQTNALNNDEKKQRLTRVPFKELPGNAREAFEVKKTFLELKGSVRAGHKRILSDSTQRYGVPGDELETQAVDSESPQPFVVPNANGGGSQHTGKVLGTRAVDPAIVQSHQGPSCGVAPGQPDNTNDTQPTAGSWQGAQGQFWQGTQGQLQPTRININLNDHLPREPVSQQALPTGGLRVGGFDGCPPVQCYNLVLPPCPMIHPAHIDFLRCQLAMAEHVYRMQCSQLTLTPGYWQNPGGPAV